MNRVTIEEVLEAYDTIKLKPTTGRYFRSRDDGFTALSVIEPWEEGGTVPAIDVCPLGALAIRRSATKEWAGKNWFQISEKQIMDYLGLNAKYLIGFTSGFDGINIPQESPWATGDEFWAGVEDGKAVRDAVQNAGLY